MSIVQMQVYGPGSLDRASALLAGIQGGIYQAVKGAMPRAVSHLRTDSTKAVQERYAISAANLRANQHINVQYTYRNGVEATVTFSGQKIPLYRYDGVYPRTPAWKKKWVRVLLQGEWRSVHPARAASGHQMKGNAPTRFGHAFVVRMESGHTGIFERTGGASPSGSDAISEMMGSSVPQMLGNETVTERLTGEALQKFEDRMEHEINALLNGWR